MVFKNLSASMALLSASVALVHASSHMIMGGLQPIAYERVDSIVNPGTIGTHVHAIMGSSSFNQNADHDSLRAGRCTSVPFQEVDKSAYWAPSVHYQNQSTGEFTLMPSTFNIYYFFDRNGPGETVQAFPEGLKMVAGNPNRATYNASNFADQAVSFVCLDYSGAVSSNPAYAERQDINFPDVNACEDGIRYQVFFPQCWDGVNLDSADHKSHMAYPVDNYNGGSCPSSHPNHTVGLFFEMLVPTSGYPHWGPDAYVLSSGDPSGLAFHGDFQNGWDVPVLQDAVENCHNMNGDIHACQVLAPYINQDQASACTLDSEIVDEDVEGPITKLPGCNPVRIPTGSAATCPNAAAAPSFVANRPSLPSGWTDVGCIAEATNGRALTAASTTSSNMSLAYCANFCQSKGFSIAGVEFGDECYCGNSLSNGASSNTVGWEQCNTACASDPVYSKCGGPDRLELLQFAPGSTPASSSVASVPSSSAIASSVVVSSSVASASASSKVASVSVSSSIASVAASSAVAASSSATASAVVSTSQVLLQQTSSSAAPAQTSAAAPSAGWTAAGCAIDGGARALTGYSFTDSTMTPAKCQSTCESKGFSIAGIEYGDECYCGNSFSNNLGQTQSADHCYMSCAGDSSSKCGGTWSLSLFTHGASTSSAVAPPASTSAVTGSNSSSSTGSSSASGTWVASGCVVDGGQRALTGFATTDPKMTNDMCISTCASKGFTIAATEYSTECYCGNSFVNGLGQTQTSNHCYMSCGGDSSAQCGGTWSLSVYKMQTTTKRSKHFGRQHQHRAVSF